MATVPGLTDKEFAELGYRFYGHPVESLDKEQLLFIIRHLIQSKDHDAEMMARLATIRQRASDRAYPMPALLARRVDHEAARATAGYPPEPVPLGKVFDQREAEDWLKGDMEVETTKDDQAYHIKMTWRPWARWLRK